MGSGAIEIWVDGGGHGFGHLTRSAVLASQLIARGHPVRVCIPSDEGKKLWFKAPQDQGPARLIIFDLPYEIEPFLSGPKKSRIPTVALDYFGSSEPDLTISILERSQPLPSGRRLSGLSYAIIREEIINLKEEPSGKGVLVIIGGGDVHKLGGETASLLADSGENVSLIEGPLVTNHFEAKNPKIKTMKNPPDLSRRMAQCQWAVTNGGATMMEMMCLGKPVVVIPQTNSEKVLASHVYNLGGLLGIGMEKLNQIPRAKFSEIGANAQKLIDGNGINLVMDKIEEFL